MRRLRRREEGVAAVEMAFLLPILLLLSVVAAEFGFALVDWMAVSNATQTSARVASAAGDDPAADTLILAAIDEAWTSAPAASLTKVEIYEVLADGSRGSENRYSGGAGSWVCGAGADPCNWPSTSRSVSLDDPDTVGITIRYDHAWVTGFWSDTAINWADTEVIRLEPNISVAP